MDATHSWVDLHDGHFESTVCMDAIHEAVDGAAWCLACRVAGHVFHFRRSTKLSLPAAGLPDREIRSPIAPRRRCDNDGPELGSGLVGRVLDVRLFDLRFVRGGRHRHHLCRYRWFDGRMVSRQAWHGSGDRCRGVRHGGGALDISSGHQYLETGLSSDAPAFWPDFWRSRILLRTGDAAATEGLDGRLHRPQQED